jgi:putative transposase
MTHQKEHTGIELALEEIISNGMEGLETAFSILINEAMRVERNRAVGADPWQRTDERVGYANGYKPRNLNTRIGKLNLQVPQVRGGISFTPKALDRGLRSERALKLAIAEMYVKGVSTRKVSDIVEKLCGLEVTSSEVSRCTKLLDEELEKWRNRPIGSIIYLILDARYEKIRQDGAVRSCAVLVATGVQSDGKRIVLGTSVSLSESEVHWRQFLSSLKTRGMHGVQMICSDDHQGLKSALTATFSGVPWNRCQTHLQRNASSYVPKMHMKAQVAQDIRDIFNAPKIEDAQRLLELSVKKYRSSASKLAAWMEDNIPEGFAVFQLPASHRRRMRTTNMVERLNKEIKRRTRVATLFPNEASLLRLVSAILMEISEDWETGRTYLSMDGGPVN